MPENINNIELRSEAVQEIIGSVPNRLVSYGITVIFIIIFMLIFGSFFFKYPDIVSGRLVLTGENPPANIISKVNGKIKLLFVSDKQYVEAGTVLAVIENTADYKDLMSLKIILNTIKETNDFKLQNIKQNLKLGELQTDYSAWQKSIIDYNNFIKLKYHQTKIDAINKRLTVYNKIFVNSKKQFQIILLDYTLSEKKHNRDSMLYKENIIPDAEFETSKSILLQKNMALETNKNNISNAELQIVNLQQEILDLELQFIDEKLKLEMLMFEQTENLKSKIALWEQNYLLISPIKGKVSFSEIWTENQNVSIESNVFTIVPEGKSSMTGHVQIPVLGSGKIKVGQNVNIKFDDFPQVEYGMVRGKVESISLISNKDYYSIRVSFPDSLKTSYKKELPFIQNMQANAEIITDDFPLIVRLFNPLKSFFKN
jgi:HlyD family secretion protein